MFLYYKTYRIGCPEGFDYRVIQYPKDDPPMSQEDMITTHHFNKFPAKCVKASTDELPKFSALDKCIELSNGYGGLFDAPETSDYINALATINHQSGGNLTGPFWVGLFFNHNPFDDEPGWYVLSLFNSIFVTS